MAKPADIQDLRARFEELKSNRSRYEPEWFELRDFIEPDCGRFHTTSKQPEFRDNRWERILDPCATEAADTLAAGMLGGMTSPARPWFQLTTMNADLDEQYEVKAWLSDVTEVLLMVFANSNVYEALHKAYLELAVFGTACLVALPSTATTLHVEALTVGEYWLADNHEGRITTMYHEYQMTAAQMIEQFGRDAVSDQVRKAYDNNKRQTTFTVIQAIEPREERDPGKADQANMPWRSVHFEWGSTSAEESGKALLEEGFTHFPAMCPRWLVKGGAVYGAGVGAKVLPLVKELQGEKEDLAYGIGYMARPPLQVPAALEGKEADWAPGGVVYVAQAGANNQIAPVMNVNFNLQHLDALMQRTEKRINAMFFRDLFLMISDSQRFDRTAYEVQQLQQEKMMLLGPVLERLHSELLSPLISSAFDYAQSFGMIPEAPEVIAGQGLNVNYISVLALAQKASALNGYSGFLQTLQAVMQVVPTSQAGDLLDADEYVRRVADMLGVDPKLLRSGEAVAQIRDARNEAAAQQAQMDQAQQMAAAGKDLMAGVAQAGSLSTMQGY